MGKKFAIRGNLVFTKERSRFTIMENAYLVCEDTKVAGAFRELPDQHRKTPVFDTHGKFVLPGMCDVHIHASQYPFQGIGQNIENCEWNTWFDRYAFPDESRFNDLEYARRTYSQFAEALLRTPTTRVCAYATTNAASTEVLMKILAEYGFAGYVGKVNMDRNCGVGLLETTEGSLRSTREWLERCHNGIGAVCPMITPRYFPSCTPEVLEGLGELAKEYNVPVQSHLSEGLDEITWVKELDPTLEYYGQAYERAGLLGPEPRAVMAHCVFPTEAEFQKLKANNVLIAHCPQSNMNSSGQTAPVMDYLNAGIEVGLGTDVGGGNTLNMFRTIFEAILASKVHRANHPIAGKRQESKQVLTLPAAFYLATKGGGTLWHSGSFEAGYCFDAVILDDSRLQNGIERSSYERLERLITRSDDREIIAKYINGRCVYYKEGTL